MVQHLKDNSYTAINWNNIEDELDKATWEKLTQQFWLDTRIPISNDLRHWRGNMTPQEQKTMNLVFGGLTTLDTLQSQDGLAQLKFDALNQKEEAVLNNIQFMESIHAKSYSSIFETLNEKSEIEAIFEWADNNEFLQYKANRINDVYQTGTPLQKKVASVMKSQKLNRFLNGLITTNFCNIRPTVSMMYTKQAHHCKRKWPLSFWKHSCSILVFIRRFISWDTTKC